MARDAYGLETPAVIQRQAEALRAGIAQDAPVYSLPELVRLDAQRQRPAGLLPAQPPLVLLPAATQQTPDDTRKEAVYVPVAHSV
jgi:hypothetical protein